MSNNTNVKTNKPFDAHRISLPSNIIIHIFFILVALTCILPLWQVVAASLTDDITLRQQGYSLIPAEYVRDDGTVARINTKAYEIIFERSDAVVLAFANSITITLIGTLCSTAVIVLYAYPISRPTFKYRKLFTWIVLITMLFSAGLVPWYIMYTQVLRLTDTMAALIIPYLVNAWYVLIMRTFFKTSLPEEILESARIDGAGEFRIFFTIALPLSTAGIATVALFSMLAYWNDWYLPLMFARSDSLNTIQNYLRSILERIQFLSRMAGQMGGVTISISELPSETIRMAIAVIAVGPIVFAYPFFQRYFIKGLTIGAIKG